MPGIALLQTRLFISFLFNLEWRGLKNLYQIEAMLLFGFFILVFLYLHKILRINIVSMVVQLEIIFGKFCEFLIIEWGLLSLV